MCLYLEMLAKMIEGCNSENTQLSEESYNYVATFIENSEVSFFNNQDESAVKIFRDLFNQLLIGVEAPQTKIQKQSTDIVKALATKLENDFEELLKRVKSRDI